MYKKSLISETSTSRPLVDLTWNDPIYPIFGGSPLSNLDLIMTEAPRGQGKCEGIRSLATIMTT